MNKPLPQTDCTPGERVNEPIAVPKEGQQPRDICQDDEEGNCGSYLEVTRG